MKGIILAGRSGRRRPQGKLVWTICSEVYDVAIDLRRGSPTFGQWERLMLEDKHYRQRPPMPV
ncbi:MAG: dTDP-4-dehydrorhamnose 3,5-epimerase family protein [Acidiferrobacterales bacterium]